MADYRFVQGIDYGPRSGTRGISLHMSEGGDGLVSYLARAAGEDLWQWADRVNGVSCNAAILSTGEIVKMLDDDHASGNLNPDDRAGEYGYYGGSYLRAVLGDGWTNPNEWTLSIELAGRRANGPTDAQVRAAIKLGNEWKAAYPDLRGATGHHDQSPKECPGLTPNMKAIFDGLGGHGLWISGGSEVTITITTLPFGGRYLVKAGTTPTGIKLDAAGAVTGSKKWVAVATDVAASYDATVTVTSIRGNPFVRCTDGFFAGHLVPASAVAETPNPAPAPADTSPYTQADLDAKVAAEHERVRTAAIAAVSAL